MSPIFCPPFLKLFKAQTGIIHASGSFLFKHEQKIDSPSYNLLLGTNCWSEVEWLLLWTFFLSCLLFVHICVTGWKVECDSQPAGAVDLGGLPSGNRSASCIDFYFHGWVIWVSALESQLGCHQGQLGRRGICFCLHQFHTVSRYECVVWILLSVHSICCYLHKLYTAILSFLPMKENFLNIIRFSSNKTYLFLTLKDLHKYYVITEFFTINFRDLLIWMWWVLHIDM